MPFSENFLLELATEQKLTNHETKVFCDLFNREMSRQQIAESLFVTESAVNTCLTGVYKKFEISGSAHGKESRLKDKLNDLQQNYRDREIFLTHQKYWEIESSSTTSLAFQKSNDSKKIIDNFSNTDYLLNKEKKLLQDILSKNLPVKNVARILNITDENKSKEALVFDIFESL